MPSCQTDGVRSDMTTHISKTIPPRVTRVSGEECTLGQEQSLREDGHHNEMVVICLLPHVTALSLRGDCAKNQTGQVLKFESGTANQLCVTR